MNKQIQEMAEIIDVSFDTIQTDCNSYDDCLSCKYNQSESTIDCKGYGVATELYNAGYRKVEQGECNFCGTPIYVKTVQHTKPLLAPITRADELRHELLNLTGEIYLLLEAKFCPLCGAKMKGE